ncbi:NAD(P)/FAD-dependent oxidoreductase [Nocardioides sp.]|uniref:NAD(P)/FAD-dependent oxidoreductase n=1 Tax=Nocardioides sp. TaxID=35761 RepID=UPI003D1322A2
MSESCDVLVIGAGLAGLQCARELQAAGREVQVWEASDDVGGRIRTDEVNGFLVDRGFQVLNPAYPAVRRWVDVEALRNKPFGAGIGVRLDDRLAVLANPVREPGQLAATLRSGLLRPAALARLARWAAPALGRPARLKTGPDLPLREALDKVGLTGDLRTIVDRFYAGVLLEDGGDTSNEFALLLLRMFALGAPGLPAAGMQALPRQLAQGLTVRTDTRVQSVVPGGAEVEVYADGAAARARTVVVATDPTTAGALTPVKAPAMKGVLTWWYAATHLPTSLDLLCVDARTRSGGPLVNVAVMTAAAPSYAPPGNHLIQASALLHPGQEPPSEAEARKHAGEIFGSSTHGWEVVARHEITHALPTQLPPLKLEQPLASGSRVLVCGDHRDTASIQGALVSGHRAAQHVLAGSR